MRKISVASHRPQRHEVPAYVGASLADNLLASFPRSSYREIKTARKIRIACHRLQRHEVSRVRRVSLVGNLLFPRLNSGRTESSAKNKRHMAQAAKVQ